MKFSHFNWQRYSVISALFVGCFLRLLQIGNDAFWFDELNVLQVVSRNTIWEAIRVTHEHVMAMPLHYALVWLTGKVSTSEGWMRLPEAIWGTLAIGVGYGLARHYLTNRQAVLSAWLMAISPLLIMYSQELRFYSGLVFFYLLTTYTGIKAIKENRLWNWALFCLVGVLGLAFHIFVFLAVLIVYAHLLTDFSGNRARGALKGLVRSTIILLFALLVLLLVFGRLPKDTWSLVSETHLLRIVLGGVGWAPPFPSDTLGWLYYFTMIAFGIIGLLTWRDWRDPKSSLFLFLALLAQIMAITLFNWIGKYFLVPRQFLFLAPFFGYYTAVGIDRAYQALFNWARTYRPSLKQLAPALFFLLLFLFAALALEQYYRLEKGVVKEALPLLQREWQEGGLICVHPEFDAVTYAYYWRDQFGASIFPCDELDPEEKANLRFILTPPTWKPLSNSYLIFKPTRPTLNERWIWELPSVR